MFDDAAQDDEGSSPDVHLAVLASVAALAKGSEPTAKWRAQWAAASASVSAEDVRAWCRMTWEMAKHVATEEAVLVGAFWGMATVAAPGTPELLADWAWRLHKGQQQKLAGAALYALGAIAAQGARPDTPDGAHDPTVTEELVSGPTLADSAIGQLQRLESRLRHRPTLKRIDQALAAVAAARGLSPDALQDLVVEDAGLSPDGSRAWEAGPYDLYLFLTEDGDVELATFERKSGRAMGAPPKLVRQDHFGALSEAKAVQKVLAESLQTQKHRLELAMEGQRAWRFDAWRQVFGRHPLMKHLASRLLWGVYLDGILVDSAAFTGTELVDRSGDHVPVPVHGELRLLHPAHLDPGAVAGWQHYVVAKRLIQPFKQAFRELYRLPPTEEALRRSTRFDGVVVRHRQMYALLRSRGWRGLAGIGPAGYVGLKDLPGSGLLAVLGFKQFRHFGDPARRQVTLYGLEFEENDQPLALGAIDPVHYSEVMRDLALVVGVAGLGQESELRDQPDPARRRVPAAMLEGQVEMRASLLRELLPSLGLAGHVRVEGDQAIVTLAGQLLTLNLATGEVSAMSSGRVLDLDSFEKSDAPLYLPFEGGDAATSTILATLMWLGKFGPGANPSE